MLSKNERLSTEVREDRSELKRRKTSFPVVTIGTMESVTATRLTVSRSMNLHKQSKHAQEVARELVEKSRELRERAASMRSHHVLSNTNNRAQVKTKDTLDYRQCAYRWDAIYKRRDPTSVLCQRFLVMKVRNNAVTTSVNRQQR